MEEKLLKTSEKLEFAIKSVWAAEEDKAWKPKGKFETLCYLFQLYETAKEDESCSDA